MDSGNGLQMPDVRERADRMLAPLGIGRWAQVHERHRVELGSDLAALGSDVVA